MEFQKATAYGINTQKLVAQIWLLFVIVSLSSSDAPPKLYVFTSIQTRLSPNHTWSYQQASGTYPQQNQRLVHEKYAVGLYKPPELLDDPVQPQLVRNHTPIFIQPGPYNIYAQRQSNYAHFYPPWYLDKFQRYPRDEPVNQVDFPNRLPWNYRPRCRSCGRPLLQDSYCSDDFVLTVYVYRRLHTTTGDQAYLIYVFEVHKDTKGRFHPTQYSQIHYRCDRFQSGPFLQQIYLITGIYIDDIPTMDSCSWKAKWQDVTKLQKRYLRRKYNMFCGLCHIQRVFRFNPTQHRRSDTCYVQLSPDRNEVTCRDRFSICHYRRKTNRCEFNQKSSYKICEKYLSPRIRYYY